MSAQQEQPPIPMTIFRDHQGTPVGIGLDVDNLTTLTETLTPIHKDMELSELPYSPILCMLFLKMLEDFQAAYSEHRQVKALDDVQQPPTHLN